MADNKLAAAEAKAAPGPGAGAAVPLLELSNVTRPTAAPAC